MKFRSVSVATIGSALALGLIASPASADPMTTVKLSVKGCEGCVFLVHSGKNIDKAWDVVTRSTPVTNGKATFSVRQSITKYVSLEVEHPKGYPAPGAAPFVAFGWVKYKNTYPGGPKRYGQICWGKQKGAKAKLNIVVRTYRARPVPAAPKETVIGARLAKLPKQAQAGVNGTPGCQRY